MQSRDFDVLWGLLSPFLLLKLLGMICCALDEAKLSKGSQYPLWYLCIFCPVIGNILKSMMRLAIQLRVKL